MNKNVYEQKFQQLPLLTREEEKELIIQSKNGDKYAKYELLNRNYPLVISIISKYKWDGISTEDLIQEGMIGLNNAIDRFEPNGGKLSTYATYYITQRIKRFYANNARTIRLPEYMVQGIDRVRKAKQEMWQESDEDITTERLARKCHMTEKEIEKAEEATSRMTVSLDQEIITSSNNANDKTLLDVVASEKANDPSEVLQKENQSKAVQKLMSRFTEKEQEVIRCKYGYDDGVTNRTNRTVAKKVGGLKESDVAEIIFYWEELVKVHKDDFI